MIAALLTITGCGNGKSAENRYPDTLSRYDYRATRQLILFVRRGADLVREKGPAAFEIMRNDPKTWKTEESYIYVYSIEGRCLYHGGMPEIEAQNLFDIIDTSGKKPIQQVIQATEDPANPDGWVHFTWTIPNRFYEVEKSSCHYRVTMPDGQIVLVGGGLTEPPEEREFARCAVDSAIRLIEKKGDKALDEIRQAGSRFRYRNVSVFVLAPDGTALVDPGIRLQTPRNLTDFIDDVGNRPFHNAYQRLKKENRIWLVVLTHSRYDRNLNKRAIYLRLSTLNGQDIMVGATVPVPKPAWSS